MPPIDPAKRPCALSWYDPALGGINTTGPPNAHAQTASGEPYSPTAFTCAAPPEYPFGTIVTFYYGSTSVTCKVNDRGGAIVGSHFDLARAPATVLGLISAGVISASFQVRAAGTPVSTRTSAAPGTPGGTAGTSSTGALPNDVANFYVGDTANPDEDFWTAINRIAQGRYWYFFSDGETAYLADGPDLMRQTPAAKVFRVQNSDKLPHMSWVWDDTAWTYAATHKRRRRTQRRTTLAKVTSPVEGNLTLIGPIDEVRGGDVVQIGEAGPADGNWLVGDCRRSVFSVSSEVALVQALQPFTEQQLGTGGTGTAGLNPNNPGALTPVSSSKLRNAIVAAATGALANAGTSSYSQRRPYPPNLNPPIHTDCSGFATLCYKAAGAPDPNGLNYNGQGFTGTLLQHGQATTHPQPGDLAFWSSPDHVAVVTSATGATVGNKANIVEFGGTPIVQSTVDAETPSHASFLGYRSYVP